MTERVGAPDQSGILIVDDDPIAIQVLRRALLEYADVRFATNGKDALRLVQERAPDVILLDGEMPGENGFAVCRKLKANPEFADIPVIFVTGHDSIDFETTALELGAADFIGKPFIPPRVQLRVRLHLQLKQQMDQLRALATTDGLTRLANRRTIDETLAREWNRAGRSGLPLSLLLIDVDFFKRYNDAYGHPAGDACLRLVAAAIGRAARRPTDLAGRFGGEEFAVILAKTGIDGALRVAETLREEVARAAIEHRASETASFVTVSIGVSCSGVVQGPHVRGSEDVGSGPACRESDLVDAADRALYLAKQRGRNRVEFVEPKASQG